MADEDRLKCMGIGIRLGDAYETMRAEASEEYTRAQEYDGEIDGDAIERVSLYLGTLDSQLNQARAECGVDLPTVSVAVDAVRTAIDAIPEEEPEGEPEEGKSPEELTSALYDAIVDLGRVLRENIPPGPV